MFCFINYPACWQTNNEPCVESEYGLDELLYSSWNTLVLYLFIESKIIFNGFHILIIMKLRKKITIFRVLLYNYFVADDTFALLGTAADYEAWTRIMSLSYFEHWKHLYYQLFEAKKSFMIIHKIHKRCLGLNGCHSLFQVKSINLTYGK